MTENEKQLLSAAKQLHDLCRDQFSVVTNVREIWKLSKLLLKLTLKHLHDDRQITDQEMADHLGLVRQSIHSQRKKS